MQRWLWFSCFVSVAALSTSHCAPDGPNVTRTEKEKLPVLGSVPRFSLIDQTGAEVGPHSLKGKPFVAAFMFTRCPSVCPRITARMKEVQKAAASQPLPLQLVSISVDPEFDTPAVLRAYASKNGIDTVSWSLWTGPYETVARAAEHGFKIGLSGKADLSKADLGITHGSHLVLVDQALHIRGYYRSFDEDVVERLIADLSRL